MRSSVLGEQRVAWTASNNDRQGLCLAGGALISGCEHPCPSQPAKSQLYGRAPGKPLPLGPSRTCSSSRRRHGDIGEQWRPRPHHGARPRASALAPGRIARGGVRRLPQWFPPMPPAESPLLRNAHEFLRGHRCAQCRGIQKACGGHEGWQDVAQDRVDWGVAEEGFLARATRRETCPRRPPGRFMKGPAPD